MRVMNNHRTVRTSAHQRTIRVVCHQNNPRLAPETCLHRLVPWSTRHVRPGRDLAVTFHAPLRFASLHRPDSPTRRFGRNGSDETGRSFQSQTPPPLGWESAHMEGVSIPRCSGTSRAVLERVGGSKFRPETSQTLHHPH